MMESIRIGKVRLQGTGIDRAFTTLLLAQVVILLSACFVRAEDQTDKIDDILTRLEKRSDGLQDIRTKVRFSEKDKVNRTTITKYGDILFRMSKPNPQFMIHFSKTEVDGILGKQEWYLFDGRWFFQAVERIKQVTKQEIARPGEQKDMFDLEKAPFPLPFGQKKETILRNFEVTLLPPAPSDPPDTDHLVCIPKPDSAMSRQYDKLEFFVSRTVDLPSRILVTKNDGFETNTADFLDLSEKSINTGVSDHDFTTPPAWRSYKEVVERLDN